MELTQYQRAVLAAVHDAPYIEPTRQTPEIRTALSELKALRLLGLSCLKAGALESTEAGARVLGYA